MRRTPRFLTLSLQERCVGIHLSMRSSEGTPTATAGTITGFHAL